MSKSIFQPCSRCKTNGKINNFNKFTFFIVVLSGRAAIKTKLSVFLSCCLGCLSAILAIKYQTQLISNLIRKTGISYEFD